MMLKMIALALAATIATAAAASAHPETNVDSYAPIMAISKIVGTKQVAGYFVTADNSCRMTLVVAEANDETLAVEPMRISFDIAAANVIEFQADANNVMRVACTADADQVKIATFQTPSI